SRRFGGPWPQTGAALRRARGSELRPPQPTGRLGAPVRGPGPAIFPPSCGNAGRSCPDLRGSSGPAAHGGARECRARGASALGPRPTKRPDLFAVVKDSLAPRGELEEQIEIAGVAG